MIISFENCTYHFDKYRLFVTVPSNICIVFGVLSVFLWLLDIDKMDIKQKDHSDYGEEAIEKGYAPQTNETETEIILKDKHKEIGKLLILFLKKLA